ncbi:MAG: hypothetical protein ACE5EC_10325 [Phycisphaerae bacterium]
MFGGRRIFRKRRRRWLVAFVVYILILAAGVYALWHFLPRDVVDAIRNTYLNPSTEIDP